MFSNIYACTWPLTLLSWYRHFNKLTAMYNHGPKPYHLLKWGDRSSKIPTITYSNVKEEFEDTKGVIRIRKLKKNRQHNGQKYKQRSTHTHTTKDRVTRTPLNAGGELRYSGKVGSSCTTSGTSRVNLITKIMLF
jgi:hypothetical protein